MFKRNIEYEDHCFEHVELTREKELIEYGND